MTICLITDRRRFANPIPDLLTQAARAVEAGVDLIQVRERDLDAAALVSLTRSICDLARGSATSVVVNDRIDVALAVDADGVHLRGDSIPTAAARTLMPPPVKIGRSIHSASEAGDAADYLIAGSVFPTASKAADTRWLGVDGLRTITSRAKSPVLAVGGLTLDRLHEIAGAGAAGIAAIGLFCCSDLRSLIAEVRARFDTVKSAS
ncbi:MAG TPA: thiamine phosphate synthase [Vicinamibacterales bacterium]